jgi:hypothetical protein
MGPKTVTVYIGCQFKLMISGENFFRQGAFNSLGREYGSVETSAVESIPHIYPRSFTLYLLTFESA